MINGILWVLGCQLVGEVLVRGLGLSIPGPVVGMVLLFGVLSWRRPGPESGTLRFSDGLLRHLQLFFVPVTVGIMVHASDLGRQWLPVTLRYPEMLAQIAPHFKYKDWGELGNDSLWFL